jgi:hypothetical protein
MSSTELYDSLLTEVATMDRARLAEQLMRFPGSVRLDFSADYLESCDTDQLRHLLLAALWRSGVKSLQH